MVAKKSKTEAETEGGRIFPNGYSVFGDFDAESYQYNYLCELTIANLVGGVPTDSQVATGWLKSKLQEPDDILRDLVAKTMLERNITADEATRIVNELKNLNGFKRLLQDGLGHEEAVEKQLMIEGRQIKAALKEAVSVAVAADKLDMTGWGKTRKWLSTYFPEHVFVVETEVPLFQKDEEGNLVPVMAPTDTLQQFVHTHRGSSIQYQERVEDAVIRFTVVADHPFKEKEWAMIWTTGQRNGLGASRSQGYGTYKVTRWEPTK
jgi:hypothetical protein